VTVWERLVGQSAAVEVLVAAATAARELVLGAAPSPGTAAMTPAWLITGPAGSGRSVAATAFAAALQCTTPGPPGCGHCAGCRTTLSGGNPDVLTMRPEGLSIATKDVRTLVLQAALAPVAGRWRVVVVEDADRLVKGVDERAANVLLKTVEEPPDRGVFVLCAPSTEDVPPTIRSRCRTLALRTPASASVAEVLRGEGVDPALAAFAAQAAQGHVGRARRLARDEGARQRRAEVLRLPMRLGSTAACVAAAADLVAATAEEAGAVAGGRDAAERASLEQALGMEPGARRAPRGAAGALKELERTQKSRGTRAQRDALDRALVDLAAWYRDVLVVQLDAQVSPVHADTGEAAARLARASSPEQTLRRIEALLRCRERLGANAAPLLAVEALTLELAGAL